MGEIFLGNDRTHGRVLMSTTMGLLWVTLGENSEFEYLLFETFTGEDFENRELDYFYATVAEGT